jgi:hypothetical protein
MLRFAQISFSTLTAIALFALASNSALAQANRTFVSGHGSDSGGCTVSVPCRTFAYALTQTASGGEITVLDTAGYGAVTITQSVTITNPGGVEAGITAGPSENAITIKAASSTVITLRGLTLQGSPSAANGVYVSSSAGGTLNIVDCIAKDFGNNGFYIQPTAGNLKLLIANSFALDNSAAGIAIDPQGGSLIATISNTYATGSAAGDGIVLTEPGNVTNFFVDMVNINASNNGIGLYLSSANVLASFIDSQSDNESNVSISVNGGAFLIMKHSMALTGINITDSNMQLFNGNNIGTITASSASVQTDKTNYIFDITGTMTGTYTLQ